MQAKTCDVLYQMRGEEYPSLHKLTTSDLAKARRFVRKLSNFPDDAIHFVITCDDGSVIEDSRK